MDELTFWKQKIVQFFHDPPGKPFAAYPGTGGHKAVASRLFAHFQGDPLRWTRGQPDWAASGADRPVFPEGIALRWPTHPRITHPLADRGAVLDVRPASLGDGSLSTAQVRAGFIETPEEIWAGDETAVEQAQQAVLATLSNWRDADELKRQYLLLWRRWRDALMADDPEMALVWQEMPADSRIPDHSIWDHLRMTSALAFLTTSHRQQLMVDAEHARTPWLLRLALSPVQAFIREARTTRDLWVGSFLLADLSWHAMQPIVERYGPDAIVYPDLRGNPLADHFLIRRRVFGVDADSLLGGLSSDAASFAALLPASFVALVPRGGEGALVDLETLAEQAREAVERRWQMLAGQVRVWLQHHLESEYRNGDWQAIWDRQHRHPPVSLRWTAVPWLRAGPSDSAAEARAKRLRPWLAPVDWEHYEGARATYRSARPGYLALERGFDYPLTHHQLLARHGLLKQQPAPGALDLPEEPGEKCTNCGRRQALSNSRSGESLDGQRRRTRRFWQQKALDPDRTGSERLCGICAFKRFLVPAGVCEPDGAGAPLTGINPNWAGLGRTVADVSHDDTVRVPFPSAATIAAQREIEAIAAHPDLIDALRAVVQAHQRAGLTPTTFPRALPRLAALETRIGRGSVQWEFLIRDAQETLFPDAVEGMARAPGLTDAQRKRLATLAEASRALRRAAREAGIAAPATRLAVVKVDGDRMGKLLLGSAEAIGARWRDVLHPEFLRRLEAREAQRPTGWSALLDRKRLMGPALHAFITRVLAEFQHRVVPWVVEREFSGRLIYSGGDDVLALVPADEALDLACRLQQLFSAPWIVDRDPEAAAWDWRRTDRACGYDQAAARQRFSALQPGSAQDPLRAPYAGQMLDHPCGEAPASVSPGHRIFPMLGTGQSLSAGIAFGHFKTPLGVMLAEASALLDEWAKERAGRGAVALGHATRGGIKNRFVMRWADGAHHHLCRVTEAFRSGALPGRLPYKLRELGGVMQAIGPNDLPTYVRGLLLGALGEGRQADPVVIDSVLRLWSEGLRPVFEARKAGDERRLAEGFERAVAGLLLCRALAGGDSEGED